MKNAINGEFKKSDRIKYSDTVKYNTLSGRILHGGGEIMPDYFVPADTTGYSDYYSKVTQKGLVYQFALDYADSKRKEFSSYKTSADFEAYFNRVNVLNLFVAFAEKKGIKSNAADLKVSSKIIENQVKAYIARNIIGEKGFYPIIQNIDKTLLQAIEKIKLPIQQNLTSIRKI